MENYYIEQTDQSPEVKFNLDGKFELNGISTPDHINRFYTPVFDWLKNYKDSSPKAIDFKMLINYLNTSSTRILVELLVLVNSFKDNNVDVNLTWKYEDDDEDMLELGEELELAADIKFIFEAIPVD